MKIREATINDLESIKNVYLEAFDDSEAKMVADFSISLLKEQHLVKIISLVAIVKNKIVGHIAFSPVFTESNNEHFGYILAPLAILPEYQNNKIGSSLVRHGLDIISNTGSVIVFVYGDPKYYSRFGFKRETAKNYSPHFKLQFPDGWQALTFNSDGLPGGGKIKCVDSLNNPELW